MRQEFPSKVKLAALERCRGVCEGAGCGAKLAIGRYHFDHDVPDALGGQPTLENCRVLCWACHKVKTAQQDVPQIAKADRQRMKHLLGRSKSASRWKRPALRKLERTGA